MLVEVHRGALLLQDQERCKAIGDLQALIDNAIGDGPLNGQLSDVTALPLDAQLGVRLSVAAKNDLAVITRAISEGAFGDDAMRRFAELRSLIGKLTALPDIGRRRGETNPPIHYLEHGEHVVLYVDHASGPLVIRILSGWQDWLHQLAG